MQTVYRVCRNSFDQACEYALQKEFRRAHPSRNQNENAPAVFFSNMEGCAVSGTTLDLQYPSAAIQTVLSEIGRFSMDQKNYRRKGSKTQKY
jgi:hypothetical protein